MNPLAIIEKKKHKNVNLKNIVNGTITLVLFNSYIKINGIKNTNIIVVLMIQIVQGKRHVAMKMNHIHLTLTLANAHPQTQAQANIIAIVTAQIYLI